MQAAPGTVSRLVLEHLNTPAADLLKTREGAATVPAPRTGVCHGQDGVRMSGVFDTIRITRCRDVVLSGVQATSLVVKASTVKVESSRIRGDGTVVRVDHSNVELTGCDVAGDVAIEVAESELDLAGVHLEGRQAAVRTVGANRILFSVSRVESPTTHGFQHGPVFLASGGQL
jgi:hypothetical protein